MPIFIHIKLNSYIILVMKVLSLFIFFSSDLFAQIASSSFFPNVRSINPGIAHLRTQGFILAESSKTQINKNQDIQSGGILDGVNTKVNLDKTTVFRAGKGPGITIELLADKETGKSVESFETSSYKRSTTTEGSSSVINGVLDLGFIGVMKATANYEYFFDFHVDEVPNLNRETHDKELNYDLTRIGTAFRLFGLSWGAYYSVQSAKGEVKSYLYNPTTGVRAPAESSDLKYETISYGLGTSYVTKKFHIEVSLEKITDQKLKQSNTYLYEEETPTKGQRLSFIGEVKLGKLALGFRVRQIEGGFTDIEQLISSNMLYLNSDESTNRLENSFNFSYGAEKGISFSGFYSTSSLQTQEESDLIDDGTKFDTQTDTVAYGLGISYLY